MTPAGSDTSIDEIVCACVDMKQSDLNAELAANPSMSFDDLLRQTGAGGKCTACLLDLEYYYTTLPRARVAAVAGGKPARTRKSLKRQLFDFLDAVSPQIPMPLVEWMPVPAVPGVTVTLWVANRPLPAGSADCAPPLDVELIVRDGSGAKKFHQTYGLESNSDLRIDVSSCLADRTVAGHVAPGSVEIRRHFRHSGRRGTTRPQLEILGPEGSCSVHSQRPTTTGGGGFTFLCRPRDERLFLSIVNPSGRELHGVAQTDFAGVGLDAGRHEFAIPAGGAMLHELRLPLDDALEGEICGVRWKVDGLSKTHILCATPSLSAFSIDHI